MSRFAPLLFEPAGTAKSTDSQQPFTLMKHYKHWYCPAEQNGRWFHAKSRVSPLVRTINSEITEVLGCPVHRPALAVLKDMCAETRAHLDLATAWMNETMEEESQESHSGLDATWFYVGTAMAGFLAELRSQRYWAFDGNVGSYEDNLKVGARVIWHLGKSIACMQEIVDAQFVSHQVCVAATGQYMNLSRATKALVKALDTRMEEEFKKFRKLLNKKE